MTIISYAQNFEDVMLWRVLKDIENGFYIDVGANDPVIDSVTKLFYENGWRGINIEPLNSHYQDLVKDRPEDVNLRVAVGNTNGEIELWETDVRGWATASEEVIKKHQEEGHTGSKQTVPMLTLTDICEQYARKDIHFLKVDVEGLEKSVLEGMDFFKYRPWVVVVEATIPNSTVEAYTEWESILTESNFLNVYNDGLNQFYIPNERINLKPAFRYPPNVFDDYIKYTQLQSEAKLQQAEVKAEQAEVKAEQAEVKAEQAEVASREYLMQLEAVYASTSWFVTKPFRVVKRIIDGDFSILRRAAVSMKLKIKKKLGNMIVSVISYVKKKPTLKNRLKQLSAMFPSLDRKLRGIYQKSKYGSQNYSTVYARGSLTLVDSDVGEIGLYNDRRVAILVPGAADGTIGGAERFYEGLANALRKNGCDVDLIHLVFNESSFDTIQQGYAAFSQLDLDEYDLVISTKAPTYVVKHRNHIMYLIHTIRVFYDMFDVVFPNKDNTLIEQRNWIHKEDSKAFKQIKYRFSIAKEVSRRLRLWNDSDAEVLYPGVVVDGLYDHGIGDYFYMPGRLHAWKRVDLAIRAVRLSKLPLKLIISGTGEAEQSLRQLAEGDKRIEFVGRVEDEKLRELYAKSLAVPFLPLREDYGYVTLEAFASGKPVVTCTDSGEPVEFVIDGVTGLVCDPNPESICLAFEQLWNDRKLAARMGKAGREKTAHVKWSHVADRLLEVGFPDIKVARLNKPVPLKVAVLDMQPIIPAVGGGRQRLLGLYHALGVDIQTRYVGTFDWPGERFRRHAITPNFEEIDVPLSSLHHEEALDAARKAGGKTVIDMLFSQQAYLSPDYLQETFDAVKWADVVIFSHPWVAPLVDSQLLEGKTVIYDSHNVEASLRSKLLNLNNPFEKLILENVINDEKIAGDHADLILACSEDDINGFVARYGWQRERIHVVPNGVFSSAIQPATVDEKLKERKGLDISEQAFVGFFIGSDYAPNVEAALFIVEHLAYELPEIIFVIGGGVCSRLPEHLPMNVRVIGFLEELDKVRWLRACDFAINPMFAGSGTNIKMFDFMSAGLPVVTTSIGARGIAQQSSSGLFLADRDDLVNAVRHLYSKRLMAKVGGQENRSLVEARYAWESISPELGRLVRKVHFRRKGAALMESSDVKSKVRVAHLSTMGLKCGIGEYTRNIINMYEKKGISNLLLAGRTANEEPDLEKLDISKDIVWFYDNIEWKNSVIDLRAIESMVDWGATHLIIQYHPGFYDPDKLVDFVLQTKEHEILVTVVLHNFVEESAGAMRRLNSMGVPIFSHRMSEVLLAKEYGVVLDQVPLGIDIDESVKSKNIINRNWIQQPPVIITTGFLRKHKGVISLIRAMPSVLQKFPESKLRIQCALYPSEDSRLELKACEKEIIKLNLVDNVILDTEFLEKKLVIDELSKADIAVLPYESSNEGGSATAADCLSVGLPLLISDAEIFDEIREVAITVKAEPDQIASAIIETLLNAEKYNTLSNKSMNYALDNSWGNVAAIFLVAHNSELFIGNLL